jgi:hypothetical protein
MTAFPDKICDNPVLVALLEIFNLKLRQLGTPQTATEKNSEHGVITFSTEFTGIESREQAAPLLRCQPIPEPDT